MRAVLSNSKSASAGTQGAPDVPALLSEYCALGGAVQFVISGSLAGTYTRYPLKPSARSREIEQALVAAGDERVAEAVCQERAQ